MAEIVNLNRARKAKARAAKEADAEANRVRHGTPKSERNRAKALHEKATGKVDAHKLDEKNDRPDD